MMMKSAAFVALLSASASAFAPSCNPQSSLVALNAAERSAALPFMNRPILVSATTKDSERSLKMKLHFYVWYLTTLLNFVLIVAIVNTRFIFPFEYLFVCGFAY